MLTRAPNVQFSGRVTNCHARRGRTMATPRLRRARDDVSPSAPTACYALPRRYRPKLEYTRKVGRGMQIASTKCSPHVVEFEGVLWCEIGRLTGVVVDEINVDLSNVAPLLD